jgi:putative transposase
MCQALEVSASGYYAWAARFDSPAQKRRQELVGRIEEIHAEVKQRYGSPRMTAELNALGHDCSENTVAKLIQKHGICARASQAFRSHDRLQSPSAGRTEPPRSEL